MAHDVDETFKTLFRNDAKQAYSKMYAYLTNAVQRQTNVAAESTVFYKFGEVSAPTTKTRGGDIPILSGTQDKVPCLLVDNVGGIYRDKLDTLKSSVDQRKLTAQALAASFASARDAQIITALATTTQEVGNYTTALTADILAQAKIKIAKARKYGTGRVYGLLHEKAWEEFKNLTKVSSSEYTGNLFPLMKGVKGFEFDNILFMMEPGLREAVGGANTSECFLWEETAVGHASTSDNLNPDIEWIGQKHAWLISAGVASNAVLVDNTGVVKIKLKTNVAIS